MARSRRRFLVARLLAGFLALLFAGCGASQIDNAPDGSELTFSPDSWDIEMFTTPCLAYVNLRDFVVTLRNGDGLPINDTPVGFTSFNGAFALVASDGTILSPDLFGRTQLTRHTDASGNVLLRVAVADCETHDDIMAVSGTATALAHITVSQLNNTPPTAVATADTTNGAAPLSVNFDASGSSDSDGTIVSYGWDFDDAGRRPPA